MLEQFRTWIEYKMAWFRLKRLGYCFKHQIPIEEQDAGLPPPPPTAGLAPFCNKCYDERCDAEESKDAAKLAKAVKDSVIVSSYKQSR